MKAKNPFRNKRNITLLSPNIQHLRMAILNKDAKVKYCKFRMIEYLCIN